MSSESKQWLLEIVLMLLALIVLASAPARSTEAQRQSDRSDNVAAVRR